MYNKSSKISESSGPVVGSTILNRKIPGSNPPRDIFHYYIFLPIITSISNFMCIYTNLSRFVVCDGSVVRGFGYKCLRTVYVGPSSRPQSRLLWNSTAVLWSSLQGNSPVGRNIPRQLCALAHV